MDEILQKLLESDLLNEETRAKISSAWKEALNSAKATAIAEATASLSEERAALATERAALQEQVQVEVRSELAEQWSKERSSIVDRADKFLNEAVEAEFAELREEFSRFRDLEAEHAALIVEEKQKLAKQFKDEVESLAESLDKFLDIVLRSEFKELAEDLQIAKNNRLGQRIFETFRHEISNASPVARRERKAVKSLQSKLSEANNRIRSLSSRNAKALREAKMEKILAPLTGNKRAQMEFILSKTPTNRLNEAYNNFINKVVREDLSKPATLVTEAANKKASTVVTGDRLPQVPATQASDKYAELKKLAGI